MIRLRNELLGSFDVVMVGSCYGDIIAGSTQAATVVDTIVGY